jgi:hypothetical protein
MNGAALPGHAEDFPDRVLEALMGVGDAQQHAAEGGRATRLRRKSRQKLSVSDLPTSRPITSRRPDSYTPWAITNAFLAHPARFADTLHFRVRPELGIAVLERSASKRGGLLVEAGARARPRPHRPPARPPRAPAPSGAAVPGDSACSFPSANPGIASSSVPTTRSPETPS